MPKKYAFEDEKYLQRMKILCKNNKKIIPENHKRDYFIIQNYLKNKKENKFEELLNNCIKKLNKYISRKEKIWDIDASLIMSKTMEIIFKKLPEFNGTSLFSTWCCGISNNVALRNYAKREVQFEDYISWTQNDFSNLIIYDILKELNNEEKIIFAYLYDGYKLSEIAKRKNIKINSLKKILINLKNKINKYFKSN